DEVPDDRQSLRRDDSRSVVRVELRSVAIRRDLETAILEIRQAVDLLDEIHPDRHRRGAETLVARRRTEVEDLLACRKDPLTEQIREDFGQPGAAGKDESSRRDGFSRPCRDRSESALAGRRQNGLLKVLDTRFGPELNDRLNRVKGLEEPALRLEDRPGNWTEVDLRPAAVELG